ncbi:hypothetical protein BSCH_00937c [Candidatus Paraburkholderia schumanniana]|nr:hypothetical protein BSCH_00937c [Candidatus Paraburkholderia schumannianae]
MIHANEIIYKGHVLTATAVSESDQYAAMLIVRDPSGARRASGTLGEFASAAGAVQYTFAYGMAEIDCRQNAMPRAAASPKSSDSRLSSNAHRTRFR